MSLGMLHFTSGNGEDVDKPALKRMKNREYILWQFAQLGLFHIGAYIYLVEDATIKFIR